MEQPPDTKPYTELTISELAGIMAMSIIATNQDPDERFRASEAIAVTLKRLGVGSAETEQGAPATTASMLLRWPVRLWRN
jgi:hypothetical protein